MAGLRAAPISWEYSRHIRADNLDTMLFFAHCHHLAIKLLRKRTPNTISSLSHWMNIGNLSRVEVPEVISAEQRCFRGLTLLSTVQRWFREHAKSQRWLALFQSWSALIFSESTLFRTENFSAEIRCFRENEFWTSADFFVFSTEQCWFSADLLWISSDSNSRGLEYQIVIT